MYKTALFCLFASLLIAAAHAESEAETPSEENEVDSADSGEFTRDEEVIVLTVDNFDATIAKYDNILVEFYAPWCGHCKALAPEYAKAAQQLKEDGSETQLGKVDATEHGSLAEKFEVRGYPTLKFFHQGKPSDYNGPRKADGIVNWLKKKTGFPATKLTTADEAKEYVAGKQVGVIGFFKDGESDNAKTFINVVRDDDDIEYAFTTEQAVFDEFEVKSDEKIVLVKQFDERRNDFEGEFTAEEIAAFVGSNSLPLFIEFTQESAQRIFSGEVKQHLLLFAKKTEEGYQAYNDTMRALGEQYRGKFLFVSIDMDKDENSRIAEFFGLGKDDYPAVRLINLGDQLVKYKPTSASLEKDELSAFIEEYNAGKLKPHLLSQDQPEDWDANPVKVLVGTNFDEIAFDKTKDVLVEFYAPWCGHCKKLSPIYDELAEAFKDNEKIVVAKIDSTANELEHTQIQSFPTLKLYKAESNEVVEYNGERTLEGLTKFLESGGEYGRGAPDSDEEGEEEEFDEEEPEEEDDGRKEEL